MRLISRIWMIFILLYPSISICEIPGLPRYNVIKKGQSAAVEMRCLGFDDYREMLDWSMGCVQMQAEVNNYRDRLDKYKIIDDKQKQQINNMQLDLDRHRTLSDDQARILINMQKLKNDAEQIAEDSRGSSRFWRTMTTVFIGTTATSIGLIVEAADEDIDSLRFTTILSAGLTGTAVAAALVYIFGD